MKTYLSILTGAASLAAVMSGAVAQTSAVTDPVGYITVNVAGGGSATVPRFTAIAPTLVNKVEYAGAIATVDTGTNKLTFSGTPFTAGAFATGYYVEVTSSVANDPDEGAWRDITGNGTSDITLSSNFAATVVAGDTIKIRRHVTISDFFGATNSAGLLASDDASTADEIVFIDANQNLRNYFYSNFPGFEGWKDLGFADASTIPFKPNQAALISRKAAAAVTFTYTGHVKTGKTQLGLANLFNVVPVPLSTGVTLGNSNLFTGNLATGVKASDDASTADEVILLKADGSLANYFNSNFPGFEGWKDLGFADASTVNLAEGTGFLLSRKGSGPFTWTAPAQVIAP